MAEQNLKNHAKFDPPFHYFLAPVALTAVIVAIVQVFQRPGWPSAFGW